MKTKDNFLEGAKITQDNQVLPTSGKEKSTKKSKKR